MKRVLAIVALLLVASLVILNRCSRLPSLEGRTVSSAPADTAHTRLGRANRMLTR